MTIPRPQFTLKTLLIWAAGVPLSIGMFAAAFRTTSSQNGFIAMWLVGAVFGGTIGYSKGRNAAIICAVLGCVLVLPLTLMAIGALAEFGFIDFD